MLIAATLFPLETVLGLPDKAFKKMVKPTLSHQEKLLFQVKHMNYDMK